MLSGSVTNLEENNSSGQELLTRAQVYKLLATGFYPPEAKISEKLWSDVISNWYQGSSTMTKLDPLEIRLEYNRLFVGPKAPPCPPYESVHRKDRRESERGMLMGPSVLDVKRRYSEAGLEISKNFSDLPDHIAVEFEFMSFLCNKEETAISVENADFWRAKQTEFWRIHLVPWVSEFSNLVQKNSKSPFYNALSSFLKEWIAEEEELSFNDLFRE
jgi:TorA maturation chaperone TorD